MAEAILIDDYGVVYHRPRRRDHASDIDYIRAFHHWRDQVTSAANTAFTEALIRELKNGTKR